MEARRIPLNPYLEADIIDSIFRANGRNQKGLRRDNDRDSSKDRPIDNDDEIVDEERYDSLSLGAGLSRHPFDLEILFYWFIVVAALWL